MNCLTKTVIWSHVSFIKESYLQVCNCTSSFGAGTQTTANSHVLQLCVRVSHLWTRDNDLTHHGQFLMPDSQIWTNYPLTHNENSIHFPPKYLMNIMNSFVNDIFGNIQADFIQQC